MNPKHWLGSKTLWVNTLGGIVSVAGMATNIIPANKAPYVVAAGAIANILLRLVTSQPLTTGDPDQHVATSGRGFAALPVLLIVAAAALASVFLVKHKPTPAQLLIAAEYGVAADCAVWTDALAKDICAFGTDAIGAAKSAIDHDAVEGRAVAKQILMDAEQRYPEFAPYIDFVLAQL